MNDYHYHLQAAIYSLIREGGLPDVHEKKGYKFFCFSNIFPYNNFEKGAEKNLLISSPRKDLLESIRKASFARLKSGLPFVVGSHEFTFGLVSEPFELQFFGHEVYVQSATPIIIRIPKERYSDYGIRPKFDYNYVFWRDTVPLEAFVKQLLGNICKKWKEYWAEENMQPDSLPQIIDYRLIRIVSKPITLKHEEQMIIGSLWELSFSVTNSPQRDILRFSMDCGLGERNSLGFGFVNLAKYKQ